MTRRSTASLPHNLAIERVGIGWNKAKTHCSRGHPYSEENTYVHPERGYRECRTCRRWHRNGTI